MFSVSDVTGKMYDPEECVFFRNAKQSASYMLWGATLIDIFADSSKQLVFVFTKADHAKYRDRWNSYRE